MFEYSTELWYCIFITTGSRGRPTPLYVLSLVHWYEVLLHHSPTTLDWFCLLLDPVVAPARFYGIEEYETGFGCSALPSPPNVTTGLNNNRLDSVIFTMLFLTDDSKSCVRGQIPDNPNTESSIGFRT